MWISGESNTSSYLASLAKANITVHFKKVFSDENSNYISLKDARIHYMIKC